MMIGIIEFKNRAPALKVMTNDKARRLKLGEYPINRCETDFFILL